jgi:HEAT repeat protein
LLNTARRRCGRWAAGLTAATLAAGGLCGCADFWDDVTSREFKFRSLWSASPNPMVVLRDSDDGDARAKALRALREPKQHGGSDADQDAVLHILSTAAVSERHPWCRLAAIETLGHFKDPRAVTALRAAYDQANTLPASAVQQASYNPGNSLAPETTAALRCHALSALGETGNAAAVDLLVRVVRQPPVEGSEAERQQAITERLTAIRALGHFKEYQATETLLKILQTEKDTALRDRAAEALQSITGKKLPPDAKAWEAELHVGANGQPPVAPARNGGFFGLFAGKEPPAPAPVPSGAAPAAIPGR